jgi:hypothetical protein
MGWQCLGLAVVDIALLRKIGGSTPGYAVLFSRPRAEIDQAATFTTKRPVRRLLAPFHRFFTGWAFYNRCHEVLHLGVAINGGDGIRRSYKAQQYKSKATSSLVCTGRGLVVVSIKRTVKRCLPPLISAK